METFLRNAEQILETAATSGESNGAGYIFCVSWTGAIRILSDVTGWSLPALAAELGAAAVYRVERASASVRVEGWSCGRKCLLTRELPGEWWTRAKTRPAYATLALPEVDGGSANDRSPHVRNS